MKKVLFVLFIYFCFISTCLASGSYFNEIKVDEGIIYENISESDLEYDVYIPRDNFETNISYKLTGVNTVVYGDGDVVLNLNKPHYISIMNGSGDFKLYKLNPILIDTTASDIKINGVDFLFKPYVKKYDIVVDYNVESLDFSIDVSSGVDYTISDTNLSVGMNEVVVNVDSGSLESSTYIFNVERKALVSNFSYTGNYQTYIVPVDGYYYLEAWGASSYNTASKGAYTAGVIYLTAGEVIYVYVGQSGGHVGDISQFNNGLANQGGVNGGGATDFRLVSGVWNNLTSLASRIMVAAGAGSGTGNTASGAGAGGGLYGYSGGGTHGGTQVSAGGRQSTSYHNSGFGTANGGCTGGGGYYGGGGATCVNGAGGGSSFISGHTGSVAINSATNITPKSGCTTGINLYSCSVHYSNKVFLDTVMIDGLGYKWTHAKGSREAMPNTSGGVYGVGIGHNGNGYASIEYLPDYVEPVLDTLMVDGVEVILTEDVYSYDVNLDSDNVSVDITGSSSDFNNVLGFEIIDIPMNNSAHLITVTNNYGDLNNYTINFNRSPLSDSSLDGIKVNGVSIESFSKENYVYDINVPFNTEFLKIEGVKTSVSQFVDVIGTSDNILTFTDNFYSVVILVTSEDGSSNMPYTLNITREKSANVRDIKLNNEDVEFVFNPINLRYDIVVPNNIYNFDIDVTTYFDEAVVTVSGDKYFDDGDVIVVTSTLNEEIKTYYLYIKKTNVIVVDGFEYTGNYQTFTASEDGIYYFEAWGATGIASRSYSGYTAGTIALKKGQVIYVYVGEGLNAINNGTSFNGGTGNHGGYPGGGATDFRLSSGSWSSSSSVASRIMVAGGSGSGSGNNLIYEGAGGGLVGYSGGGTHGGTQVSAGARQYSGYYNSGFGYASGGCSGGNGYYGGGGSTCVYGAGGGSSFISGHTGSVAIVSSSNLSPKPGCATGTYNQECSKHYSNLVFYDTVMIDGMGYNWTNVKGGVVAMPNPSGGYYNLGVGHYGNGYAKITKLSSLSNNNYLDSITLNDGEIDIEFKPWITEYDILLDANQTDLLIDAVAKDGGAVIVGTGNKVIDNTSFIFEVSVTASNGDVRVYTLNVSRSLSSDGFASDILINKMYGYLCKNERHCQYEFNNLVTDYNIEIPTDLKTVELEVIKAHDFQNVILRKMVDGSYVLVSDFNLVFEDVVNNYQVEVISEDLSTSTIYNYSFVVDPASNNKLSSLTISNPVIDFDFDPLKSIYYLTIDSEYSSFDVNYIPEVSSSVVSVVGNENLKIGVNNCYVTVTSENGSKRTYILSVYKETDSNAYLSSLEVSSDGNIYDLSPSFNKIFNDYLVEVGSDVTDLIVTGVAESADSFVNVSNTDLSAGMNKIDITVTSLAGDVNIYNLSVIKEKDSNALLSDIKIDGVSVVDFDSTFYDYEVLVDKGLESLDLEIIPSSSTTTYRVINNKLLNRITEVLIITSALDGSSLTYKLGVVKNESSDATLSNIITDGGSLNEEFDSNLLNYTMQVSNDVSSIDVSGIVSEKDAFVNGNGVYALEIGENVVELIVTAEDGSSLTYSVTITRGLGTDTSIKSVNHNRFSEVTKIDDNNYLINVQNEVLDITLDVVANSNVATVIGNKKYVLKTGENNIYITVRAQNGDEEIYNIKVVRDLSSNDDLDFLLIHEGALVPGFMDTTIYYEVQVPNSVSDLTIEAITEDSGASYEIIGGNELVVGENIVIVRVTAEDLVHTKDYTLKVIREDVHSSLLTLSSLTVSVGELVPAFSSDTRLYNVLVENDVTSILVNGVLSDSSFRIKGNGSYDLKVGKNVIALTALDDEGNLLDYQVVVTRKLSNDASLNNIIIKSHALDQTFNKEVLEYNVITTGTSLDFTLIETSEEDASYEVVGNSDFVTGINEVFINVVAPDGESSLTYKINVDKRPSDNNNLSDIITGFELSPLFHKSNTLYRIEVENEVNSINIEGIKEDSSATLSGNGVYELEIGRNIFQLLVTSESGNSKSYAIIVERKGSSNNYLKDLYTSEGKLDFDKNKLEYDIFVSNDVDDIFVYGLTEDVGAIVNGFISYDLDEGLNVINIDVTASNGEVRTYILNVTREDINSPFIKSLDAGDYSFDSEFDKNIYEYSVSVDNEITSLDLSYILEDPLGFASISGNENFVVGSNVVTITVLASDFVTEQVYTINVVRKMYTDNFLDSLEVSTGDLSPMFDPSEINYEVLVDSNLKEISVLASILNGSTITGNGTYELVLDETMIYIEVTSDIGITRIYSIKVIKNYSSNNFLRSLEIRDFDTIFSLEPEFDKSVNSYTINLGHEVDRVIVGGVSDDYRSLVSGVGTYELKAGNNEINVTVTAEDGTLNIYKVNINKEYSTNNSVALITPSLGVLDKEFSPDIKEYNLEVEATDNLLAFDVVLEDFKAKVSGSDEMGILNGMSVRTVTITAEDGSLNVYAFNIVKVASDVLLKELSILGYDFSFDSNKFVYDLSVSSNKKMLYESEITAITNDPLAHVNLMGDVNLPYSYIVEVIGSDNYTIQEYIININNNNDDLKLSSNIYDIVDNYVIVSSMNVVDVVSNFNNSENVYIYKNDLIYEGMSATDLDIKLVIDDYVYDSLKMILLGDLNGDSRVNVLDRVLLNNHLNKEVILDSMYLIAGDVNKDNYVNNLDSNLLDDIILKKE